MLEHFALGELARLAGAFTLDGLVIVGALAAAFFFPTIRRFALEVAAVAFVAGLLYGKGVHDEHLLCAAQQQIAEQQAHQRDKDQAQLAADDEQKSAAELKGDSLKDKEASDALRNADKNCHPITPDELR